MAFENFKVLTFDVVGTLIDFESGVLRSVKQLAGAQAVKYSEDDILDAYREARVESPDRSHEAFRKVYLGIAKKLKLPTDAASSNTFADAMPAWPAFADSAEAMRRLRRHFRLVAMTNVYRTTFTAHAKTLGNPFHDSVTLDEMPFAKPDVRFYAYNLGRQEAAGFRKDEILHVAQSQYHDIGIAREEGYKTCWIERRMGKKGLGGNADPGKFTEPHFHFGTLAQFADAVDKERSTSH